MMLARMRSGIGGVTAIVIIVFALWMWKRSPDLSLLLATRPVYPRLELWAVRSAALAAAVGAQWLLLGGVVIEFYEERESDRFVRTIAGFVAAVAIIAALGLALAGR